MGRSKRSFDLLMLLWPLGKVQNWAARHPLLGRFVHADVSPDRNRHIIIPVNRVISGTESVVLPPAVLEALVARASRHVDAEPMPLPPRRGLPYLPARPRLPLPGGRGGADQPRIGPQPGPGGGAGPRAAGGGTGPRADDRPCGLRRRAAGHRLRPDAGGMLLLRLLLHRAPRTCAAAPTSSATRCCACPACASRSDLRAPAAAPVSTSVT